MAKNTLTMVLSEGIAPMIDTALSALEFVPGMGMAIGILKIRDDFQSRALTAKFKAFLGGLGDQSPDDVKVMIETFSDPDKKQAMGETLLLTLNSYTTLNKCEWLGNLFQCYLKGMLSNSEFRRLALIINNAFDEDLQSFIDYFIHEKPGDDGFLDHLALLGLAYENRQADPIWKSKGKGPIVLTHSGQKLVEALRHIHGSPPPPWVTPPTP